MAWALARRVLDLLRCIRRYTYILRVIYATHRSLRFQRQTMVGDNNLGCVDGAKCMEL